MTNRLRLLFISTRFLFPADSGGKIRTTQILRGLKGGIFEVTLAMPASDQQLKDWSAELDAICDHIAVWQNAQTGKAVEFLKRSVSILRAEPVPVVTDWSAEGANRIQSLLTESYDCVVFDFPHSAILQKGELTLPSVMFTHNIEAEIFKRHRDIAKNPFYRWIWRNQLTKMQRFERETLRRFDTVIAVSERDREYFNHQYEIKHSRSIPTGVDTQFFGWKFPLDVPQIVFCGSMDWMANIDGIEYFAADVWPLIRRSIPEARMRVVGRSPAPALINRIRRKYPEWEFTGFVDDVRDYVGGSAAFVIPLRVGGGTRIKAFEAMAMGTPVVSTSIGVEGLPVQDGEHFLRADTAEKFAAQVVRLLRNSKLRSSISRKARSLVEESFSNVKAAKVFEKICLETVSFSETVSN